MIKIHVIVNQNLEYLWKETSDGFIFVVDL